MFTYLHPQIRVQELCESRGGRPGPPVLMSFMVSVDVKQHWTMHTHWSQFVPNMSTRHPRTLSSTSSSSLTSSDLTWQTCKYEDINSSSGTSSIEDEHLVEFMYLIFTRMPGESYRQGLRSLLYLCYVFRALINSLVCSLRSKDIRGSKERYIYYDKIKHCEYLG